MKFDPKDVSEVEKRFEQKNNRFILQLTHVIFLS